MSKSSLFLSAALCIASQALLAQDLTDAQQDLRINPDIEYSQVKSIISYPSYVRIGNNHIIMNGDDWTSLAQSLRGADSTRINIVHIGDSHLQADMGTAVTRNRLSQQFGTAGRALVIPFKLAGTNEPNDYTISTSAVMNKSRLLKTPWSTPMGFTGISLQPSMELFDFNLSCNEPFDSIEVLYTGMDLQLYQCDSIGTYKEPGRLKIGLESPATSASLTLKGTKDIAIHGFNLLKGNTGIAYNVIGNNGATYSTYNALDNFASDISRFNPALIIISLGTNEAFGKTSNEELSSQIYKMVKNLRSECPGAKLLITTPSECQRKIVTRGRKGRRRRYTSYLVNANINRLRNVILNFGKEHGIPVYDFYDVAGGDGSSFKWLKDQYLNKDRIHLTHAGYKLQGNLFTDALEEALTPATDK